MEATDKINAAVRACLESVPHGGSPLAHMAAFIETLKTDHKLSDEEVREVETVVRRILTTLIDPGDDTPI
jgi:hypothetical protein